MPRALISATLILLVGCKSLPVQKIETTTAYALPTGYELTVTNLCDSINPAAPFIQKVETPAAEVEIRWIKGDLEVLVKNDTIYQVQKERIEIPVEVVREKTVYPWKLLVGIFVAGILVGLLVRFRNPLKLLLPW